MNSSTAPSRERSPRLPMLIFGGAVIFLLFIVRGMQPESGRGPTILSAEPSRQGRARASADLPDFPATVVDDIERQGYVSVTVHVGLHDRAAAGAPYADGDDPRTNLYWGALYGLDTHFANAAKWTRVYRDGGDDPRILARSVFHKRVPVSEHWGAFGLAGEFDVYVLALAWGHEHLVDAMEQPIRDALCGRPHTIRINGRPIAFGAGSAMVGYAGENHMLEEYWDPLARLHGCRPDRRIGIFYACPRSAVVLHMPLIETGLYPVLFTRNAITPEAYVVDGILNAFMIGDLDDGFIDSAATQYARYQKRVGIESARSMFIR